MSAYRAYQSTASASPLGHVLRSTSTVAAATAAALGQDTKICIYQPVAHLITQQQQQQQRSRCRCRRRQRCYNMLHITLTSMPQRCCSKEDVEPPHKVNEFKIEEAFKSF